MTRILALGLGALLLAACGEQASPRLGALGEWESAEPELEVTLRFNEDSTFRMVVPGMEGRGVYSQDESGRLVIQPEGEMAESVPSGYTAEIEGDTLTLCLRGLTMCSRLRRVTGGSP
jgi:hypothetical protein